MGADKPEGRNRATALQQAGETLGDEGGIMRLQRALGRRGESRGAQGTGQVTGHGFDGHLNMG